MLHGISAVQVSDLAAGSKQSPLGIRHDKHRGFFVEGLSEQPCATCQEALIFMHKGLTTRHIRLVIFPLLCCDVIDLLCDLRHLPSSQKCRSDLCSFLWLRSHRLNEYSSRGHCIMTLKFETTPLLNRGTSSSSTFNTAGQPMKKYGKLVLVDLAGSERLKVISHLTITYLLRGR